MKSGSELLARRSVLIRVCSENRWLRKASPKGGSIPLTLGCNTTDRCVKHDIKKAQSHLQQTERCFAYHRMTVSVKQKEDHHFLLVSEGFYLHRQAHHSPEPENALRAADNIQEQSKDTFLFTTELQEHSLLLHSSLLVWKSYVCQVLGYAGICRGWGPVLARPGSISRQGLPPNTNHSVLKQCWLCLQPLELIKLPYKL